MIDDGFEWVQIKEFKTREIVYVNLTTGECKYGYPTDGKVKNMSENQWWELVDNKSGRYYYYNSETAETVWDKPITADIISLSKVQKKTESFKREIENTGIPAQEKVREWLTLAGCDAEINRNVCIDDKRVSKITNEKLGANYIACSFANLNSHRDFTESQLKNYPSLSQPKRQFPKTNLAYNKNTHHNFYTQELDYQDECPPPPPPRSASTLMKRHSNFEQKNNRPVSLMHDGQFNQLNEIRDKENNLFICNSMSQSTVLESGKSTIELQQNETLSTTTATINSKNDYKHAEGDEEEANLLFNDDDEDLMFEHDPNLPFKLLQEDNSFLIDRNESMDSDKNDKTSNDNFDKSISSLVISEDLVEEKTHNSITCIFTWPKGIIKDEDGQNVQNTMTFNKGLLNRRILQFTDKLAKKHICEIFKMIQSFMGDRKTRFSRPDLASVIVQRAVNNPQIRDEVLAQICKQTTMNPSIESLSRGWELMSVCLYYFPPSNNFREALLEYIDFRVKILQKNSELIESVNHQFMGNTNFNNNNNKNSLALAIALAKGNDPSSIIKPTTIKPVSVPTPTRKNEKINFHDMNNGVKYLKFPDGPWSQNINYSHFIRASLKCFYRSIKLSPATSRNRLNTNDSASSSISIAEICHVKDFILKPWLFGSTLDEIMMVQYSRFSHLRIPWIQVFLTEEILRYKGHKQEGIFRLSCDLDELSRTRLNLERLFEPFQVVQLWSPIVIKNKSFESENVSMSESNKKFHIIRPPPENWSDSIKSYTPEVPSPLEFTEQVDLFLRVDDLTHEPGKNDRSSVLLPTTIQKVPSQYMLLTPRSDWPISLSDSNQDSDPNLPACLLKMWLRELAEPIIPESFESACLDLCKINFEEQDAKNNGQTGKEVLARECCFIIRKLPNLNRRCLLYLVKLLQFLSLSENAEVSLMDSRNLATVIGPNLFRTKNKLDPRELLENVRRQSNFLMILIENLPIESETVRLNWEERSNPPHYFKCLQEDSLRPPLVRLNNDGTTILC